MNTNAENKKSFTLDTSVILHDAKCVFSFAEHDVIIPISTLEEVDRFKVGNEDRNLQAREFSRILNVLSEFGDIQIGVPIHPDIPNSGRLRVVNERNIKIRGRSEKEAFDRASTDNRILETARRLKQQGRSGKVILVTNDNMLRNKARSIGLTAEEYKREAVKDIKSLSVDGREVQVESDSLIVTLQKGNVVDYDDFLAEEPLPNQYFVLRSPHNTTLAFYNAEDGKVHSILNRDISACGIKPRNAEQTFAMHASLNPYVTVVALNGRAGTGKTLMALAAALHQRKDFRQVLVARPIVALSNNDLGYLPGEIKDKIAPYMDAVWDNFGVVLNQFNEGSPEAGKIHELRQSKKIDVLPLAYIRGRSFSKLLIIVDEAQNLTPLEIKTVITRLGENAKIILTGDIFQIDTPYLNVETNGLSHAIDRYRRHRISTFAHVNLRKGERSRTAEIAAEIL